MVTSLKMDFVVKLQTVSLLLVLTIITKEHCAATVKDNCPFNNISISVLEDPPYVDDTNISNGIISEFIMYALTACFDAKSCEKNLQWRSLHSEEEIVTAIKKKQAQLVFPIPSRLITSSKRLAKTVEYYPVVTSPGFALIVNYHACKKIANKALSQSVSSVWPILAFGILLAGISGVFVWGLVSIYSN